MFRYARYAVLSVTIGAAAAASTAGCNLQLPGDGGADGGTTPGADAGPAPSGDAAAEASNPDGGGRDGDDKGGGPIGTPLDPTNVNSPLGMNISAPIDYYSELQLLDAFKTSRPWASNTPQPIATDASGNITSLAAGQVATTYMLWDLAGHFPAGRYTVLYEGDGSGLEYAAGATKNAGLSKPGVDVLDVDPKNNGILMRVKSIAPNDKLRNIRVILPGGSCSNDQLKTCTDDAACGAGNKCTSYVDNYDKQIFYPPFLASIRHYKIIRFMDFLGTNNSEVKTFADRSKVGDARYSVKGAPLELAVELANRIGADAWINMPHLADDDYLTQAATLVKGKLSPSLKVYVEYSNEVWNAQFKQFFYAADQGKALGYGPSPFEALLKFQSKRSVDAFKAFTTAFGADAAKRVVRVMGSMAANDFVSDTELDFQDAYKSTDAVAIAPYFGGYLGTPEQQAKTSAMTADELFAEIDAKALPEAIGWMNKTAASAKRHNVKMVAYEGGQHLVGVTGVENDAKVTALFDAVNRDARMQAVYKKYLDAWKTQGGEMFVAFASCGLYNKFGRWGAIEYLDQPRETAPKYQALEQFIKDNSK